MSSFVLKIIAALSMLLDHMGLLLFPQLPWLRVLGRLAFPIYAFCIAEGFRHTRSRKRYFLQVFLLGLVCQIVYFVADGSLYLGVLIVFSLSIGLMWAFDRVKKAEAPGKRRLNAALFALLLAAVALLCTYMEVDYGFWGIMLAFVYFACEKPEHGLALFTAVLLLLCLRLASTGFEVQWWSLMTLPLIYAYNGQPGKYRLKYFLYIFYPAHLAALYLIAMLPLFS